MTRLTKESGQGVFGPGSLWMVFLIVLALVLLTGLALLLVGLSARARGPTVTPVVTDLPVLQPTVKII